MVFSLNWIDITILLFLVLIAIEGIRIGFLSQFLAIAGFFSALFLTGWLYPHILPIHDRTIQTLINTTLVLLTAIFAAICSSSLGQSIHWSFRLGKLIGSRKLETLETILGGVPAILAGLTLVWLLGVAIGRMPFVGFSNSVSDSLIVQSLTHVLPPVPAVFAEFDKHINPNAQPYVSVAPRPQPSFNYREPDFNTAKTKAAPSVVRITSFSCNDITAGSGFVIGKDLVATNAHVIAGSRRPIIKYMGQSYEGIPVEFDSNLDFAILRVQHLDAPPLTLSTNSATIDSTVAILGYPGGNYTATPGIVRDTQAVSVRSIYDQGVFGRGVYVVQAAIDFGSSGSPVVLSSGQVTGIIFSKSTQIPDIAYALTSAILSPAVHKAANANTRVSTGACMS